MNPKSWLSRYQNNSIKYLTIMLLFYHGVGIFLLIGGMEIINLFVSDYQEPDIPHKILPVLLAGPIEETIFFGLPYYLSGNTFVVLGTGIFWTTLHIFNTDTLDLNYLAYANWLFVIPSLFFSLRTWISNKGWFSIIVHSAWNIIFFYLGCFTGELNCDYSIDSSDIMVIFISIMLMILTYFAMLYRRRKTIEKNLRTGAQ